METGSAVRPQLVRLSVAARMLGVGVWTIRQLIKDGTLEPVRFGTNGWTRVRLEQVEALLDPGPKAA